MLTRDEILALARDLESEQVERKRGGGIPKKIRETICAFANDMANSRQTGYILVGINDNGTLANLVFSDEEMLFFTTVRDNGVVLPLPDISVYKVEIEPGAEVAVIEVTPHPQPPVRYDGRTWIRIGPRLCMATADDEMVLVERRYNNSRAWDEWVSQGAELDDLRRDFIRTDYLPRRIAPEILASDTRSDIDLLETLRLWGRGIRRSGPTHAAVLLFGRDPRQFYAGLWLQFVRFEGEDRSSKVIDDREYDGDVFKQLRCLEKIEQHLRLITLPDGRQVPEYPAEAIREALINAIMHRDFNQHSPIQFNWFSNRIEILNAGGLMQAVDPEVFTRHGPPPGFRGRRTAYRNEAISEAMRAYDYVQKFGTGVPKIRNTLAANGNPYAWFIWSELTFQVTLYSVTEPKFETDQEEFLYLLHKEGNEKLGGILERMDQKAALLEQQANEAKLEADRAMARWKTDHAKVVTANNAQARATQQATAAQANADAARLALQAAEAAQALAEAKALAAEADARAERSARGAAEARVQVEAMRAELAAAKAETERAKRETEALKAQHALRSSLYALLAARGITLPAAARERIEQCTDLDQLSTYIAHAATANAPDDIIEP